MKFAVNCLLLLSILVSTFFSLEIKDTYIRNYVGNQVFKLTNVEETGGGTGFVIKIPGKAPVIMTNGHVCEGISANSNSDKIKAHQGKKSFLVSIIKIYKEHDLCAIEAPKGYSGLTLGSTPSEGDLITIVGHPMLKPLTLSRGQVIGMVETMIATKQVDSASQCDVGEIVVPSFFGLYCVKKYNSLGTNAVALPGNSGSPIVNSLGQVVAVLFASDNSVYWGNAVPLGELQKFILELSK